MNTTNQFYLKLINNPIYKSLDSINQKYIYNILSELNVITFDSNFQYSYPLKFSFTWTSNLYPESWFKFFESIGFIVQVNKPEIIQVNKPEYDPFLKHTIITFSLTYKE